MVNRVLRLFTLTVPALFLLFALTPEGQNLPSRLRDETFWQLVTELSESEGEFPSDNFISNERSYTEVLPDLKNRVEPGGVYLGVGPEQNFTYIAAIKPRIAFIIDIRRQNLIEQLMYKALFELSPDRREFLSRLFSRSLPATPNEPILEDLLVSLRDSPADETLFASNLAAIRRQLSITHGFKLTDGDESKLEYVFRAFYSLGPNINYNGPPERNANGYFPTYSDLLLEAGPLGMRDNFLSSEDNFRIVQELQKNNMIIPLVGNFAGPSAIRALGDYLRTNDAEISAFYVSNVEQYLFFQGSDDWAIFYRNVGSLPRESQAVLIRTLLQKDSGMYTDSPIIRQNNRFRMMLFSIQELLSRFEAGRITNYADALHTGNLSIPDASSMEVENTPQPNNVGVVEWPELRPPSGLQAIFVSPSEIRLLWRNTGKGDKTAFRISRQVEGEWIKPIRVNYAAVCGSDPCVFRDTNLKAQTRHCYFVEAGTDYSDLGPPLEEDFGEPSAILCISGSSAPRK